MTYDYTFNPVDVWFGQVVWKAKADNIDHHYTCT